MSQIKVGSKVQCGVYVLGEYVPTCEGIVVKQSSDGSVSQVDVTSLHGDAHWLIWEATEHLRLVEDSQA